MPAIQGTLTKYSSPFRPATGLYIGAPVWQLTADSSGIGTDVASGFATKAKSATGSGLGTESGSGTRVVLRDATGSGTGGDSAVIAGSNQLRLGYLTDFTFGFTNGGGRFYLGPANYYVTASGSGVGAESASGLHISPRTATGDGFAGESTSTDLEILFRQATGSGVSTEEADPFLFLIRQGSGSGLGTSSVTFIRGHIRLASGSGLGSGTGVRLVTNIRTASGSGVGSESSTGRLVAIRTASASGEGTASSVSIELLPRTASGSGAGATSEGATWSKSRIFRVPQTTTYSFTSWMGESKSDRLFSHVPPLIRAENLFKTTTGDYTINNPGSEDTAKIYHGAHNIFLDDTEVAELTAAGYGAYIT